MDVTNIYIHKQTYACMYRIHFNFDLKFIARSSKLPHIYQDLKLKSTNLCKSAHVVRIPMTIAQRFIDVKVLEINHVPRNLFAGRA